MEITARSKILGIRLRKLRSDARMTAEQVAAVLRSSVSRVYAIEGGYRLLSSAELTGLIDHTYLRPDLTANLEALRATAAEPDPQFVDDWKAYPNVDCGLSLYAELEFMAVHIIDTTVDIIPGEFQTTAYSMLQHRRTGKSAAVAEQFTRVRMARQDRLLNRDEPPTIDCILTEGALDRARAVEGQLEALGVWAKWPNISIRVIPHDAGPHNLLCTFVVLRFGDGIPSIVYMDGITDSIMLDREEDVSAALKAHASVELLALDCSQSLWLIDQARHAR